MHAPSGVVCLCACVLVTAVNPATWPNISKYSLRGRLAWAVGPRYHVLCIRWDCTLTQPGEYDGSICVAAAVRSVDAVTVATCVSVARQTGYSGDTRNVA